MDMSEALHWKKEEEEKEAEIRKIATEFVLSSNIQGHKLLFEPNIVLEGQLGFLIINFLNKIPHVTLILQADLAYSTNL